MFVERFAQAVASWTWQQEPPHGKKVEVAVVSRILQYSFVFLLYNVHFLFFLLLVSSLRIRSSIHLWPSLDRASARLRRNLYRNVHTTTSCARTRKPNHPQAIELHSCLPTIQTCNRRRIASIPLHGHRGLPGILHDLHHPARRHRSTPALPVSSALLDRSLDCDNRFGHFYPCLGTERQICLAFDYQHPP